MDLKATTSRFKMWVESWRRCRATSFTRAGAWNGGKEIKEEEAISVREQTDREGEGNEAATRRDRVVVSVIFKEDGVIVGWVLKGDNVTDLKAQSLGLNMWW